jgi:hypothetical protein
MQLTESIRLQRKLKTNIFFKSRIKKYFKSRIAFLLHQRLKPRLPDGTFSNQNPNLGKFWRVLQWKMLKYFLAILVSFAAIRYILWTFLLWSFSIFFQFWYVVPRKIWQPWLKLSLAGTQKVVCPNT